MKKLIFVVMLLMAVVWASPADYKLLAGATLFKSTEPVGGDIEIAIYTFRGEFGPGVAAGGGVEFSLARGFALEADALYMQKGSRLRVEDMGMPIGHVMKIVHELTFPVLLKVYLQPGAAPYLVGGGEFAWVMSGGGEKTDYGLVCGIGCRIPMGRHRLGIEARYHHGLRDMLSETCMLRKMRTFALMASISL